MEILTRLGGNIGNPHPGLNPLGKSLRAPAEFKLIAFGQLHPYLDLFHVRSAYIQVPPVDQVASRRSYHGEDTAMKRAGAAQKDKFVFFPVKLELGKCADLNFFSY